jgi:hypothetical protein
MKNVNRDAYQFDRGDERIDEFIAGMQRLYIWALLGINVLSA